VSNQNLLARELGEELDELDGSVGIAEDFRRFPEVEIGAGRRGLRGDAENQRATSNHHGTSLR